MLNDNFKIDSSLQSQIDQARQAGKTTDEIEPRAVKAWYNMHETKIFIELKNGVVIGFPKKLLQGLESAASGQLSEVEVTPSGYGLHWKSLDVDLGVPQLVAFIFGTQAWMTELGRLGGQVRSTAKEKASRENGKLGGRPRKTKTHIEKSSR
jgi:hypothetical protein